MAECVFCLSTLSFLTWVIVLKKQIEGMKTEIVDLEQKLQKQWGKKAPQVNYTRTPAVWNTVRGQMA